MAIRRRPRGTLDNPVTLGWVVQKDQRERFIEIAKRSEISAAVLFEMVVDHLELTDQGIPPWMPEKNRDGELPIDRD
ncbi:MULTISPECIES: hypothetical protein [Cryobacterium]|uniref:CopG family transcriptional regulator n=1 Tax=Cryobacterium breve TaxID=1259258 RepID=A0ABY2J1Q3_9MICO|nr:MULTISPECIES: hypothetical protein [Cryobacterium]TFC93008.1 hypothetical protein E3T20_11155 [Cryobacterium sp. TmT3-12]TFC98875.1 hypothetical protein E3O65_06980 [Cryobacterium breve]